MHKPSPHQPSTSAQPHAREADHTFDRRTILRGILAAATAALVGSQPLPATANEAEEGKTAVVDVEKAKLIFEREISQLYPSTQNKASMMALTGWFGYAVARGFFSDNLKKFTALNNEALHQLTVFSPTSGVAMAASEVTVRMPLLHFGNEYDKEMLHHESDEVFGNIYLVVLMSYLAHFAEQGITVSPEVDAILQEKTRGAFNVVSGGWKLDEAAERPAQEAEKKEWEAHMGKAKADMQKAATDLLTYSAATAILVVPTVYGTSNFSQNDERKYPIAAFEYYKAKAYLEGKRDDEADQYAITEANKAFEQFFSFKLAFIDNIVAGLGVDGPCIPVFIKLFQANGLKGIANYYKMMAPNIAKWTMVGLAQLETKIFGIKDGSFASLTAKAVGETLLNGVIVNAAIIAEAFKKVYTDNQVDIGASHVHQTFTRPTHVNGASYRNPPEGAKKREAALVDGLSSYIASQGKIAFSFDMNVGGFADGLKEWTKEAFGHLAHPLAKMGETEHTETRFHQETALTNDLHAVMLERYRVLTEWETADTDLKRAIITELVSDDPVIAQAYGGKEIGALMEDSGFLQYISSHLSQVFRTDSEIFRKLCTNADGSEKYPALDEPRKSHVVRLAVAKFVKSLRMDKKHAKKGYHPEAAKEVFGALSGQLVGAAIASSMAHWLLTKNVEFNTEQQDEMKTALDQTFNRHEAGGTYPLLDFADKIAADQNQKRGEMSKRTVQQFGLGKAKVMQLVDDYHRVAKADDKETTQRAMEEVIKAFSELIANIYRIGRPAEMHGNLGKILAVAGGMTPVADNIAAVLFAISAGEQSIKEVFGEENLEKQIQIPVVPGLPLDTTMTVYEVLVIMAAMIGINLGNGSLWGNGVQLGEKLKVIAGVNSQNIGDLRIEEVAALKTPEKFNLIVNPYARLADLWTAADVYVLLDHLNDALMEKKEA